jgi:hypothetical protein
MCEAGHLFEVTGAASPSTARFFRQDHRMAPDIDRTADACVAAALRQDHHGLVALMSDLDPHELRRLAGRLAISAADALVGWAEDSGATHEQAAEIWHRGILLRDAADPEE